MGMSPRGVVSAASRGFFRRRSRSARGSRRGVGVSYHAKAGPVCGPGRCSRRSRVVLMTEPEDFGFSPVRTLAHVSEAVQAPGHTGFWHALIADLLKIDPELSASTSPDPSDPSHSHQFFSLPASGRGAGAHDRAVRIGGLVIDPPEGVRVGAGVVALHGYGNPGPLSGERERWRAVSERGVRVLAVRVRGYPGSSRDVGDWLDKTAFGGGWITRGLDEAAGGVGAGSGGEAARGWGLVGAVADVVQAVRALHGTLAAGTPIYLSGESFGGGLAVIAAALLARVGPVDRLCVGLPSLGDWSWRLEHATKRGAGAGWEVEVFLEHHRHLHEGVRQLLALTDAAVHARQVDVPALCKLARRDDVVPAPAAAAVFNALRADPGLKWRFVVPYGHFDGGLGAARRHALFERCRTAFLDPRRSPEESMGEWEPRLHHGDQGPPGETLRETQGGLFGEGGEGGSPAPLDEDRRVIEAYERAGRTLDDLPYTEAFELLLGELGGEAAPRDVLHRLQTLRKAGRLPRLGRSATRPPAITAEEESLLSALVSDAAGGLGRRDRLPYAPEFDRLVEEFNIRTGRAMSPHDVWRLVAKLAK
ncbi:MAG: hypothetical protein EA378_07365 [Phycisphaerales bacterium]|nr:MAG: hypothetical protein EA378_07365 [Phycisphaerales bacterium]